MEIKTDLQNDFAWALFNRYRKHCNQQESEMGIQHFAKYLVSCGVIRERTVARFMVTELYPQCMAACNGRKLEAIAMLADETGLSERTIRAMVGKPERYGVK